MTPWPFVVAGGMAASANWWATATERSTMETVAKPLAAVAAIAVAATAGGPGAVAAWCVAAGHLLFRAMVGSASFMVSDALVGWRQFVARQASRGLALGVMVTYHLAIFGLALYPRWA